MRIRALRSLFLSFAILACGGPTPGPATPPEPSAKPAEPVPQATAETPPPPPKEEPAPAPKALEAIAPTVKVLETGAAPKKALRYKFKVGTTEYLEMDMKLAMALEMGGKQAPKTDLPTIRTLMRVDAKELTPEGDLRCTFNAEKVDVLKDAQVPPKLREELEKEVKALVGMKGKARISPRGVASETDFELPPNAPEKLKNQIESMRDSVRQMYVPFPEEEVGKGAKWEVSSRVPLSGAMMDTKMVYTLTSLDDGGAKADVDTTLSAPANQPMRLGQLPPGASATLESLSGKGNGKVQPTFAKLASSGTNKINMDTVFTMSMGNEKIHMKMGSDVTVSSRPGKAPAGGGAAPAAAPKK